MGLKIKITKKNKKLMHFKTISGGFLETNKGVHLINRKLKLSYLTEKDFAAIKIGKEFKIKNYALSFTSSENDIIKFNKLLPKENKIYKIETKSAIKNLKSMFKVGKNFLIDRGDLSKEISIEKVPLAQRYIISISKKFKKRNIYVATNLLETMIKSPNPTRAEANDIFNTMEMGASGLVLAAETAIGNYPEECVKFIKKIFSSYTKNYINKKKLFNFI
jgi:Pyruvate kinase